MSVKYRGHKIQIDNWGKLSLKGYAIKDITEIKGLKSLSTLTKLELRKNLISEIKGLEKLKELRELSLSTNNITEINGLEALTNLVRLNLSDNQITELKGLESLQNLEVLVLNRNQIAEIKNLDSLTKLKHLSIQNNKLTEIKGIENLSNLEIFELTNDQISKKRAVLTKINEDIKVHLNKITEIKGLSTHTNLRILSLGRNMITEIKGLQTLTNLEQISLEDNLITEIEGFENLTNLKELNLNDNLISEIKGVESLTKLEKLRLNNNPITEMQSLDTNTNLKTLSLDGIKLRDIKNLNYLLMHLNIDKSGIERRIILEESPKQQESSKIAYPFDMGMNLIKFGDFEAAIDIYFNLIRSSGAPDVKIANAYAYLGDIYIALAKFTRALRCYQKASNIGLNLYKRVKIASIFFAQASQGRFKKPDFSQQHIDQVKIESIGPVSWNEIGVHYQINGFYEEAYKSYRRALELNQKDESALRNLERLKEMF